MLWLAYTFLTANIFSANKMKRVACMFRAIVSKALSPGGLWGAAERPLHGVTVVIGLLLQTAFPEVLLTLHIPQTGSFSK